MDTTVWLRGAFSGKAVPLTVRCGALGRDLLPPRDQGYPVDSLYVKCNGRLVGVDEELQNGLVYSLEPRLCGGKGGFGSMLRALGAQIEKTTNREACRDLSGRRLRDVNHENAMADWVKQQAEREAEKEQRRLERLQRKLAEPKHYFTNLEYQKQCSEMSERLEDSVLKGMQASSSSMVLPEASNGRKRPSVSETKPPSLKKKCFWTGFEGVEDSGSSDGGESDGENLPSASGVSAEYKRSPADCMGGDTSGESSSEESEAYDLPSTTLESRLDHHVGNLRGGFVGDLVKTQSQSPDAQLENNTVDQETAAAVETAEEVTDKSCRSKEIKRCNLPTESAEKAQEQIGDFGNGLHCPIMTVEGSSPSELNGVSRSEYDERPTKEEERIQEKEVLAEDGICPPILSAFMALDQGSNAPTQVDSSTACTHSHVGEEKRLKNRVKQADLPVDLMTFTSAPELECLGLETLKQELITRGLKCGGTLQERAARLLSVRGLTREQIDPTLFAKPSKGKKK